MNSYFVIEENWKTTRIVRRSMWTHAELGSEKQGRIHEPKSRAGGQERRKKLSVTAKCDRPTDRVGYRVACT